MTTAADTLVAKHPDRVSQLKGPVFEYLKKGMPYTKDPQDLYMQVFYPKARKWNPSTEFSATVRKQNPGIKTVADYVRKVQVAVGPKLLPYEEQALKKVASDLGVTRDSLYKLIAFESSWDPKAKNKISGARGLIQFMPSTALWMGYEKGMGFATVALVLGALYLLKRYGFI